MDCIKRDRLKRLGLKINYYRKLKGLSCDELAEKAGMSISMIQKLESPTLPKEPSLSALWRISDALDVDISKLFVDD